MTRSELDPCRCFRLFAFPGDVESTDVPRLIGEQLALVRDDGRTGEERRHDDVLLDGMESEGEYAACDRLAIGAELLVNAAEARRRQKTAGPVCALANLKQARISGDRFERIARGPFFRVVRLAK